MTLVLAFLAVLGIATAFLLPKRAVAFALGVILPIDFISGVNPTYLDASRYGLLIILFVRTRRDTSRDGNPFVLMCFAGLVFIGLASVAKGLDGSPEQLVRGIIGILSALAGVLLSQRRGLHKDLLRGFILGMAASAADIALQVAGLPFFGMPSAFGFRYSGFSFNSTTLAPLLAIAAVLTLSSWLWPRPQGGARLIVLTFRLVVLAVLLGGLYESQGRGGVLSLAVAVGAMLLHKSRRSRIRIALLAGLGLAVMVRFRSQLETLILRSDSSDVTTGRGDLNAKAWQAFVADPVFGATPNDLESLNPHTPFLTFAIEAGFVGLMVAVLLTVALSIVLFRRPIPGGGHVFVVRCMAIIVLMTSLLEPDGLYVGLSKVLLLSIVLGQGLLTPREATTPSGFDASRPASPFATIINKPLAGPPSRRI